MSNAFEPKHVPSDIVTRWPGMALSLWKRSFTQQAIILLTAALLIKCLPAWSTVIAFLIAPSLFIISFAAVQIADEKVRFSWGDLADLVLPGALRLAQVSFRFALVFGLGAIALANLSAALQPNPSVAEQHAALESVTSAPPEAGAVAEHPFNLAVEFLDFCAAWTEGVMAMVFLGMFIVAIYLGIFGVILHAQMGIGMRESRLYGWQAWQINSGSIEKALRDAPSTFWRRLAGILFVVICAFQTVYLSPVGLVLATYIPALAYVAFRSIFFGTHENVPNSARVTSDKDRRFVLSV